MEERMTKDEYRKLAEKGKRWFFTYLMREADGSLGDEDARRVAKTACSMFRRKMKEDDAFLQNVKEFCAAPRTAEEKNAYFMKVMQRFVREEKFKETLYRKFPEHYARTELSCSGDER